MLPLPGSPGASLSRYKARISALFQGVDARVCLAFWLFGLINNVLYVIILSAALDLVGTSVPKGVVLLADVVPSFLTKLVAPYFIHAVPYSSRVLVLVTLSICGMLLIALTPASKDGAAIALKLVGAMLASLSSGGGELSFLGLTYYYGHFSLAAWSSGTGAAGLIGAGAYVIATTTMGLSVKSSLLAFSFLPLVMILSFYLLLPREPLESSYAKGVAYESIDQVDSQNHENDSDSAEHDPIQHEDPTLPEYRALPSTSVHSARSFSASDHNKSAIGKFQANLKRARRLFFPYMLPLLLVYIAEYTINQGVAPTLLFPLDESPFREYRSFYPTYNAIYQLAVFVSRSSTPFFRIHHLYFPSCLQVFNLLLLMFHALFDFIPSIYIIFAIVFWEGLLGGLVYVSTFAEITDNVPREDREFSLGATTVSDSGGICIAGFLGMALEVALCSWQVRHGRDYCRRLRD